MNIYIAYEINLWSYTQRANFTLGNSLFGNLKLAKNTDPSKYSYSGYAIRFDAYRGFLISDGFVKT